MTEDRESETRAGADSKAKDRLRDLTDELELIISSLTIFAFLYSQASRRYVIPIAFAPDFEMSLE